jgi:hypothetical protein
VIAPGMKKPPSGGFFVPFPALASVKWSLFAIETGLQDTM